MRLSEMKRVLAAGGIQLTKSLGQNFLHDANQLRRIVAAAELSGSDKVLEIGPGLGPLTELLLTEASEVLAIEKDTRLAQVLEDWFRVGQANPRSGSAKPRPAVSAHYSGLRLINADALAWLQGEPRDWTGWKLVANLPYSVASPILVELAQAERGPERLVATLQLEVARRLMAQAGETDYGVLTLLVQLDYEPAGWFKVPASCFFPEPAVDSACICLVRRRGPPLRMEQRPTFAAIVKRAFSQRRKMMLKLLKTDWPSDKLERAFAELEIPPQARAETIRLEQFVHLTEKLGIA